MSEMQKSSDLAARFINSVHNWRESVNQFRTKHWEILSFLKPTNHCQKLKVKLKNGTHKIFVADFTKHTRKIRYYLKLMFNSETFWRIWLREVFIIKSFCRYKTNFLFLYIYINLEIGLLSLIVTSTCNVFATMVWFLKNYDIS